MPRTWWDQRKSEADMVPDFEDNDHLPQTPGGGRRARPLSPPFHADDGSRRRATHRPHDLRRSFASVLKFELQEDTRTVMQLLGQKNEATTERYLGIASGASSAAMQRLSELLAGSEQASSVRRRE